MTLEIVTHVLVQNFVVSVFDHYAECICDCTVCNTVGLERTGVGEETEYGRRTIFGFDIAEIAPFDAETNHRFEDRIVLAAVDETRADVMVRKEIEETVSFLFGTFRIIEELLETGFFLGMRFRANRRRGNIFSAVRHESTN